MSLEKWLKPEEKEKKSKDGKTKKQNQIDKNNRGELTSQVHSSTLLNVMRFKLECTKSSCKYQKIIIKKNLIEKDKTCPRCKSKMKVK
ncbi:MAG: hypothetical protein ACFE8E_00795 [Candidatus Hodarchaeota archaeon]